ncbi:MAG TPA: Apocarotenoid-15,15'-oxygenase [Cyanobacteria bacterium UBA11149]|nr:Apocarotenoid-15,15'-oxygenase [Cyanobacteria bacterium UBA11367]HBE56154.1 Apocarotenoid-15,15'-oxygenase [Cyanobacteria bacterium UBA11366]HBK63393.1 Apocarotenoid-15,15'-oxygenase [Cyanobacteria bacterium UBA11166]HBR73003.1 Apocarotenoid-15,15'-oxygenase [Cyanobacteria bacterium UBA11159]HBS69425.1 Apocarotenoid-15,15'-oxygenase [Cyanobacteria bacterium UBA11153]HBW91941.1 Apocarotenoid-15,15'-oxygenase [Cyanobacteria bacterium UBA11149]HCA96004.1 Apocarotenoid-15,15'-oxygenase [Cyanob
MLTQENISQPKQSKSYNLKAWSMGYESQPNEYDYWIDEVEGEIPHQLEGTLFRNGPGLFDINGIRIQHPFDGDGMISAIAFRGGKAHFINRFVRTEGYVAEQKAGKFLYRGVFGTQKPGGWLANIFDLKNKEIANTNVIYWGGKLLALWEASEPYCLNPKTLETIGKDYLDGILAPGEAFSAHPRFDPSCQWNNGNPCLVNFAIKPGISTTITIYEINQDGKLLHSQKVSVPGFAFVHDFAITPNYCIFFQNPVTLNPFPFLLGLKGAGECLKFYPHKPTKIIVIPRNQGMGKQKQSQEGVKILETTAGFIFHHGNAFEQGDEICVDSICYNSLSQVETKGDFREIDFDAMSPGQLWRFTLNLKDLTVKNQLLLERCCEFPYVNPHRVGHDYRYLFIGAAHNPTGNAPLQAILKLDINNSEEQIWSGAPHGFVSEPIFVPRPHATTEDDGWVLSLVYDSSHHRSDVVILDGRNLNEEPVARLHLKHHIPYGLHGSWTPQVF